MLSLSGPREAMEDLLLKKRLRRLSGAIEKRSRIDADEENADHADGEGSCRENIADHVDGALRRLLHIKEVHDAQVVIDGNDAGEDADHGDPRMPGVDSRFEDIELRHEAARGRQSGQ